MNINRLLKKTSWTGREAGQLVLTDIMERFIQAKKGEPDKPILTEAQQKLLKSGLHDNADIDDYNGYISAFTWYSTYYNVSQVQAQYAQVQYRILNSFLQQAIMAEDTYKYIESLPAVMTKSQYERIKAQKVQEQLTDENGEPLALNVFNLIERAFTFYMAQLENNPRKANPLKAIKEKYSTAPLQSKLCIKEYNRIAHNGYYELEDGTRSDQVTEDEWQAKLAPELKEYLDKSAQGMTQEESAKALEAKVLARARAVYNGKQLSYVNSPSWHAYEEPPANLTKWQLLEQDNLLELYPADLDNTEDSWSDDNFYNSMLDFTKEFPALVSVLLKDIDKKYPALCGEGISLAKTPVEEWIYTIASYEKLHDLNYYGFRQELESVENIFADNYRALMNGVSIIQPSEYIQRNINEAGDYVEPSEKFYSSMLPYSLEAFFPESEEYDTMSRMAEEARAAIINGYNYVRAYGYACKLGAEALGVPQLQEFDYNGAEYLKNQMDGFNKLVPILYDLISDTNYPNEKLKQKKLAVLKDIFYPLEYSEKPPTPTQWKQARVAALTYTPYKNGNSTIMLEMLGWKDTSL